MASLDQPPARAAESDSAENPIDPDSSLVHRACPLCASVESQVVISSRDRLLQVPGWFHVSRCSRCGALFQNPCIAPELLERYYPDHYESYSLPEKQISDTARWLLRKRKGYFHLDAGPAPGPMRRLFAAWSAGAQMLPDYVPDGKLLEIGCASGERLSLLRELGWSECAGIEYNLQAARRACERGFQVYPGPVEHNIDRFTPGSLDVIIAGSVLEHLPDPQLFIRSVAAKLKPGGQLILSTITVDSLDFRIYRECWYNLDLPRHFTLFRKIDLRRLISKHFVLTGRYHQYSLNDFQKSALCRSRRKKMLLDGIVLKAGGYLTPVCQALALLGRTSRICLYARRKQLQ
ncbi:MAG TPA: class I SAM-dependent methyltransferase [Acidobacteriota bacterium]|jgi:2-polyprenyl-3-methyl-5-hydroxy-6-metoxy-1,4-benzoquinol methylase